MVNDQSAQGTAPWPCAPRPEGWASSGSPLPALSPDLDERFEPTPADRVWSALSALGNDRGRRSAALQAFKSLEATLSDRGFAARDRFIGPLVDALFSNRDRIRVQLDSGVIMELLYRSRIAREVVLRDEPRPDHLHEPQTTKLLRCLTEGARHVLVGGAYGGDHAIPLAFHLGPQGGWLHAFEPNPEQFAVLQRNLELNLLTNTRCYPVGLWRNSRARLRLIGEDAESSAVPPDDPDEHEVSATSIDDYGQVMGIERFDLIQLDLAGGELAALQGSRRYLQLPASSAPDIVVALRRPLFDRWSTLQEAPLVRFLREAGYTVFAVRDFQANMAGLKDTKVELIEPEAAHIDRSVDELNLVAVKDPCRLERPEAFRRVEGVSPCLLRHGDPELHFPTEWREAKNEADQQIDGLRSPML